MSIEFRKLISYARPYRSLVAGAILLMSLVGLAEGVIALLITPLFDRVLDPKTSGAALKLLTVPYFHRAIYVNSFLPRSVRFVWSVFAIALCIVFLGKALAEFFGDLLVQYAGQSAVTDLRNQVYGKIIYQPVGFFQKQGTGRLVSAVINDIERIRSAYSEWLADFFQQIFTLAFLVLVLFYINWRLAVGCMVLLPAVVWPVGKLGRRIRRSVESSQKRLAELSQILHETASGNRIVKAFGMERFEIEKFKQAARRLLWDNMRWVTAYAVTSPLMELLGAVVLCLIVLYARDEIRYGLMTTGMVITFAYALLRVYTPVKRLGGIYQHFQLAIGASRQVFAFLALGEEGVERAGAGQLPPFSRAVEFDNVGFAYDDGGTVLKNVRLSVRRGEVVAIVGLSGAGKTTLVNLLPRFYEVTQGAIRIDGADIRGVTLRSLREQIAIVTQETILFNDTVWNNICYGRPGVSAARVIAAAKAALAHDFILQLPGRYDTRLGERGQRLSGGERQRLAIARALLKDAPILILDEATSQLDAESEQLVQRALGNLMAGRTVFVIAHRLATVRGADRIVVIEDGEIRETGTHAELLARGGLYTRLCELQFANGEAVARPAGTLGG
ncbi:MAG TPA: ABC transporter ATP-binding protein [Candidatus Acidoferrales bacterium]|nr:ABC transporter ATP-binding protein [Candidatus Acidoferrales bacterium]